MDKLRIVLLVGLICALFVHANGFPQKREIETPAVDEIIEDDVENASNVAVKGSDEDEDSDSDSYEFGDFDFATALGEPDFKRKRSNDDDLYDIFRLIE